MNAPVASHKLIKGSTGDWEVVIGMEVHAQVTSNSKLFSGASTAFGGEPNSHVSLVDAAMPGMLPVINAECVRQAVRTGLGLKAKNKINLKSVFDRKNYFYPDLPQGYQISQYKSPIVGEGEVVVDMPDGETVRVGIERLHLEQDAGKLLHDQSQSMSLVDLNRAGVALMEIVSKPDLRSADEAMEFLRKLRLILLFLGTCNGDMHKGNLRADVNVSVRKPGGALGTRCEIKNLNSYRFIGEAINYEARRQIDIIEDGGKIDQETRLFDPSKGETRPMRTKEEAHDYRYFPDPDLLPLELSSDFIAELEKHLPELPDTKRVKYIKDYGLSANDANILIARPARAAYFEKMVEDGADPKAAANWFINDYLARVGDSQDEEGQEETAEPDESPVPALLGTAGPTRQTGLTGPSGPTGPYHRETPRLGPTGPAANTEIVKMVSSGDISRTSAREVLEILIQIGPVAEPTDVRIVVEHRQMKQDMNLGEIGKLVDDIVAKNPDKVADVRANPKAIGWFIAEVRRASGGQANARIVNDLLQKKIGI